MSKSKSVIIKNAVCFVIALVIMCFALSCLHTHAVNLGVNEDNPNLYGDSGSKVTIDLGSGEAQDTSSALDLLFLLALIALIPTVLLMATSFTRIIIALSFLKNAMGTQNSPPSQVIIGLAVFLTLFIMMPVINEINDSAYKPYVAGSITQEEALTEGIKPLKVFMLRQVYKDDLNMFMEIADSKNVINIKNYDSQDSLKELSLLVIMPSFILSEIKRGFLIGFLIYIPFLIIDMVVASTLMSMGMMMLPPAMISMPFKLMLFILADGWNLMIQSLISGFN